MILVVISVSEVVLDLSFDLVMQFSVVVLCDFLEAKFDEIVLPQAKHSIS